MLIYERITPYRGIESISLYQSLENVKAVLQRSGVSFREELWTSEYETTQNPWTVLIVDDVMSLFFARNMKLFKIVFWEGYRGALPNDIKTGIEMDEARKIDPTLVYDDWEEDYQSQLGFWIEDNPETGRVLSISIFIKEILDDDIFDLCEW